MWLIVIISVAFLIGLISYYKGKEKSAIEEGIAINRGQDFFKQIHIFKTKTASLDVIYQKMEKSAFSERSISSKFDPQSEKVVFVNNEVGGSFVATLKFRDRKEGLFLYAFQFDHWRTHNGGISYKDMLGGNIVLTSIEKAMIALDSETTITREFVKVKSKTTLL